MNEVILTMKGIHKSFPGVHALNGVDLEVRKGEVLALMGENGAGKSTLMKVLTGIYQKDEGEIIYEGKSVEFLSPREAQDAGITIVHQEINMMGQLTVAQNIFIGREFMNGKIIDDKKMNEEAAKLFQRLNIEIDPCEVIDNLTVGKQQMITAIKGIVWWSWQRVPVQMKGVIWFLQMMSSGLKKERQKMQKVTEDCRLK